jgi:uncharacterized SAM-binding protein YcdF (DUF218 family)
VTGALLGFFFSGSSPIVATAIAALWLWRRPTSALARRFLLTVAACYVVAAMPIAPYLVSRPLVAGYHKFQASDVGDGRTAIVLLGAGDEYIEGWDGHVMVTEAIEASRVLEAARVFTLISPAALISSGGRSHPDNPGEPSSITMRDELLRLGVPADRIVLESDSRNTRDEAVLIAPMIGKLGVRHVVLVTSDTHMRRSLGTFRGAGVDAVPAVAPDPRWPRKWIWWVWPQSDGLDLTSSVARELGGIPYYWLRGWWRS